MAKRPARPRNPNQLAKLILDITTGECPNDFPKGPDSAATQARHKRGLRGGKARAKQLTAEHKSLRVTPAMEAGVSDHVWSLEKTAGLAE